MKSGRYVVVVDTETTGFGKTDRILEIAAVTIDLETLKIVDEFDSLVNPMRDISNSDIHGITPLMVSAAPTFDEIAPTLASLLHGRTIAAHNLPFDARMLSQEFSRAGGVFHSGDGICTLKLTRSKLIDACTRFGIQIDQQHRALSDARATALLLIALIDEIPAHGPTQIEELVGSANPRTYRREHAIGGDMVPTLRMRRSLLFPTSDPNKVCYLDVLDHYLEDWILSDLEKESLDVLASDFGIVKDEVRQLHGDYFASVVRGVLRDSIVTEAETVMLQQIRSALDLEEVPIPETSSIEIASTFVIGTRVCFTGEVIENGVAYPREALEAKAAAMGFQPVSTVTKKNCDLLVAADPTSMSGKAQKARGWGIAVLGPRDLPGLID